jgi:Na+/H+ antiporter NhaD/arsenite permease-like protein
MVISGTLTETEAVAALNIRTLSVLFGMMVLIVGLMQSGLPTNLGYIVLNRCRSPKVLMAATVFASGFASAIMLNDTVCLLGTPLILAMTTQAEISPVPFLFALTTSANIGSVMTLTGNPQNILIGHASGWSWSAFALRMTPIAFVCLIVNWLLLLVFFRTSLSPEANNFNRHPAGSEITVNRPLAVKGGSAFLGLLIALIIGAPMDLSALTAATLLLVWANRPPSEILDSVDWSLLLFFAGLFVVVAGFAKADSTILNEAVSFLGGRFTLRNTFSLSGVSLLGSNIFSNVPFVLMAGQWVNKMENPKFFWLLLSLTSTFAGNLTLFGSVANLIVARTAQRSVALSFTQFLKVGVPVTFVTTTVGVLLLYALGIMGLI